VSNNSWCTLGDIAQEGSIARLQHHNNAIVFSRNSEVFGKYWLRPPTKPDEKLPYFTKSWRTLGIAFTNDWVDHRDWPDTLRARGYPDLDADGGDPRFEAPRDGDFRLKQRSKARNAGRRIAVELPDNSVWSPSVPFHVGWYQDDASVFERLRYRRLPDNFMTGPAMQA
jgi:hypothetical protein